MNDHMAESERIRKYEPFFGKWFLNNELGRGSEATVFEIVSDDEEGRKSRAALKYLHIPSSEATKKELLEMMPDKESVQNWCNTRLDWIREEIDFLSQNKNQHNLVGCKDYMIVKNPGSEDIGWDVLILMDYLFPVYDFLRRENASQLDVINLWKDIANALVCCERQDKVVIDINPRRIYISEQGIYKLSYFEVFFREYYFMNRIGHMPFLAPEILQHDTFDNRISYYSLGLTVYYYLNGRRFPFMPPHHERINHYDVEAAYERRYQGEKIPPIPYVSEKVNKVLLKSLEYKPEDRYGSAAVLLSAIQIILDEEKNELQRKPLNVSGLQKNAECGHQGGKRKWIDFFLNWMKGDRE